MDGWIDQAHAMDHGPRPCGGQLREASMDSVDGSCGEEQLSCPFTTPAAACMHTFPAPVLPPTHTCMPLCTCLPCTLSHSLHFSWASGLHSDLQGEGCFISDESSEIIRDHQRSSVMIGLDHDHEPPGVGDASNSPFVYVPP